MEQVLNNIISFPVVFYTVPLAICLVFWLSSLLGFFDLDLFDVDVDSDVGVAGLFATLGLAGVPLTLSLSLLFFFAWSLSLISVQWLLPLIPLGILTVVAAIAVLIISFIFSVFLTGKITRPLSRLFVTHEAESNQSLVSKTCVISTMKVSDDFGQAKVEDGEAGLIISVRAELPNTLTKGDNALIYEYDSEKNIYFVLKQDSFSS